MLNDMAGTGTIFCNIKKMNYIEIVSNSASPTCTNRGNSITLVTNAKDRAISHCDYS
jgi:hypothetical protein